MSDEWITHRKPKASDAHKGVVWASRNDYTDSVPWRTVNEGEPWQPIKEPTPYVKPKRYEALYFNNAWVVFEPSIDAVIAFNIPSKEQAERIAAIYEEVMP